MRQDRIWFAHTNRFVIQMWHAVRFVALESLFPSSYILKLLFLAGVCFDHALCCVGVARQNFHKLITLWFFGASSGFNTLSWNQKPKELGERHFNWIREVNRHRKAKRYGMGWRSSWRTEISKNPPLRRYIHLCWAIHGLVSLYLGIWVSAKCTRRDDRRKQINRVWTPK